MNITHNSNNGAFVAVLMHDDVVTHGNLLEKVLIKGIMRWHRLSRQSLRALVARCEVAG